MDITYLGKTSFKIKGKTASVVTNPERNLEVDIVTMSNNDSGKKNIDLVKNYTKALTGPGEYEVKGISFIGIASENNTIFVIEVDGLRICHLGDLKQKLTDGQLKVVGDIDILIVPDTVLDKVVSQIEPYFIIPMGESELVDKYLKECGLVVEKLDKLTIKEEELIDDQPAKVVLMEAKK